MANLHTDDRDPLRTTRDTNTTHVRTASARSGGAGWIIALVVLVALAIAAWIYSDSGTVAVDDTAPRVTTEPATPGAAPETTSPGAAAPAQDAPAGSAPLNSAPADSAPANTAPAGSAPADTAPADGATTPAAPPAGGEAPANN